ncbi:hypothetical protein N7520_000973 [Penicillium odoratum]|uniref:uncharacterized protein n=1 Tax=Penicillium odoratum TaxID=1167516 RepID=UPI002547AA2D|nr:uncharacterized protein N7520_000973 [Penicillium odoratum]KAJ5777727.1 hypothetical protein N7520_000973 [Penicillium odoratum]
MKRNVLACSVQLNVKRLKDSVPKLQHSMKRLQDSMLKLQNNVRLLKGFYNLILPIRVAFRNTAVGSCERASAPEPLDLEYVTAELLSVSLPCLDYYV